MNTINNIGLIECSPSGQFDRMRDLNGYHLKKVLLNNSPESIFKSQYPGVEIVDDKGSIINDDSIELVIVSGPSAIDMDIVNEALQAGKHVRIL